MTELKLKSLRALQEIKRDEKNEKEPLQTKRPKLSQKILCFIALIIFTLVVGGTGGVILDRFGLSYLLVQFPELNKYEFLKSVNERTVVVEKTVETKISVDQAGVEAIKKVTPSLATVSFFQKETGDNKNTNFLDSDANKKTGFIFTSDGLVVAKTDRPPEKNEVVKIEFQDGDISEARWVGFNKSNGIAILKVENNNLPMVTFSDSNNLELGEKLIAAGGKVIMDASVSRIVNNYSSVINPKDENGVAARKRIIITKNLPPNLYGAPLINLKGEIIGISQKEDLIIPINEIKDFVDEVLKKQTVH